MAQAFQAVAAKVGECVIRFIAAHSGDPVFSRYLTD